MSSGPEYEKVEKPLLDHLASLGWQVAFADPVVPGCGRESFRDVLLLDDLRAALHRINLDPGGRPWLDEGRIHQAIAALQRLGMRKLTEANAAASELIVGGATVDGVDGWEEGRGQSVRFIDWDEPANNTFRAVSQLRVACPPGQPDKHIKPDVVLFVNGIPLVVIECKHAHPTALEAMEEAVTQLHRYANRRRGLGLVECNEGNEQLFHYAQFVVATCGEDARAGTFSSLAVHYQQWKDTSPVSMAEVAAELGKPVEALTSQEVLTAGMLRPAHLLDIVRHFTLFMESGGRTIKVVCRYQQFRAVQRATQRLLTGKTRREDGEQDRRGGIVWHTQGSGKSLTMVFLIRKMQSDPRLRAFKIVVVTDRRDLQKQLAETAELTGEVLKIVKPQTRGGRTLSSHAVLKEVLAEPGSGLVFAMIQKYRGELADADMAAETPSPGYGPEGGGGVDEDEDVADDLRLPRFSAPLPVLNDSESILVLIDEAHRGHTSALHANLLAALPNCARIGFTGTPIIMREKGKTARIFGSEIDRYTIREAEADGATVRILYEGRTAGAAVDSGGELDELFEDMLQDRSPEELERIQKKYATKKDVQEAPALVGAKARNMLRHYVDHVLPNGFKAQVVAVSRRATLRYRAAFLEAQQELVDALERLPAEVRDLDTEATAGLDRERAFLARAHRFLPTIRVLEFAPVISGGHNDTVDPERKWSDQALIDTRVARFKKPLFAGEPNTFDPEKSDALAFLIVKSMLLTGFDAPIEQVMYLDRHIQEAELLQAIARVNRTYAHKQGEREIEKQFGIVVDYYGVVRHLKEALEAYSEQDVEGALESLRDEIPKLRDRHRRAVDVFYARGLQGLENVEKCVELLRDERTRAEFQVKLKQFLTTLDLVLPRPEALPYVADAKTMALIQAKARLRYRGDERLIGKEVGEKVRKLIDDHIVSLGIDPKIPPIDITSAGFEMHVERERSPRAKASEMEHALRHHIKKHLDEDPTYYGKLSDRLKEILKEFEGRWEEMCDALKELVKRARQGRGEDESHGLDPATQAPFFELLAQSTGGVEPGSETEARLLELTVELVDHIRQEIAIVDFWSRLPAQTGLRSWVVQTLDSAGPWESLAEIESLADRVMELAEANHDRLIR